MTKLIDLRSDTVTRPSEAMKLAMLKAPLGDDVYQEDPSVRALEERTAALCGKEAALFCPSGTMSNQIALGLHLQPGDEVLGHPDNHVFVWEAGGIARLWQATYKPITSKNAKLARQLLTVDDFANQINPNDQHYTKTKLVCLENTLNRGGGRIFPLDLSREIGAWARQHGLRMHLDGARLWNAASSSGIPVHLWAEPFDSVSLCLSKGLGCPVGSLLVGRQDAIRAQGIRLRKLLGGGLRQAGMLAAAGLYALDHHRERLHDDHLHAQRLYEVIGNHPYFEPESEVQTNIVWFTLAEHAPWDAYEVADKLKAQGILVTAFGSHTLRVVTHLDVDTNDVETFCQVLNALRK